MNSPRILVTGASGLVGTALTDAFRAEGYAVTELDIRADAPSMRGDIRDAARVRQAMQDCDGVVHLAAISRVVTAQQGPELCRSTNVDGLRTVLDAAWAASRRPWLIFASSREVYGQPPVLPVDEDCPLAPVNVYGRSKAAGETLVEDARKRGQRACTIRLSNVFGSVDDHPDRVIPAFVRAALSGQPLRVDGDAHTFDFTHTSDVAMAILALTRLLLSGQTPPPPIQFVSGAPTTLGDLARLVVDLAGSRSVIRQAPSREFDVARFVGNGARAKALLGWEAQVSLRAGLEHLIADQRAKTAEAVAEGRVA